MTALEDAQSRVIRAKRKKAKVKLLIEQDYGSLAGLRVKIGTSSDGTKEGRHARRIMARYEGADQEYCSALAELNGIEREASTARGTA